MSDFEQTLKIPKERVAILIGTKGETKKALEKDTNSKINVDSEGAVTITSKDSISSWIAKQIVKAIGRGFSPEIARLLLNDNYVFELIELKDFASNEKGMKRLKGRVIGERGKAQKTIEELTDGYIAIFGKTIGLIAEVSKMETLRTAIEMLLSGARHATVFAKLEKQRRNWKRDELLGNINNI